MMKSIGDRVKKGETIALQEQWFGYLLLEWKASCDGEIVAIESGGLITIRAEDLGSSN
jgi:predicted deacylase